MVEPSLPCGSCLLAVGGFALVVLGFLGLGWDECGLCDASELNESLGQRGWLQLGLILALRKIFGEGFALLCSLGWLYLLPVLSCA